MSELVNPPERWVLSTIGEIFDAVGGGTPSTEHEEFWKGHIPWITSADIDALGHITPRRSITEKAIDSSATNKVPAGSVVVVTRVGLGKVGIAETDLCFSQDCQALVFDRKLIEPKFVAQQMSLATRRFHHVARGTTISGVTKKELRDTLFAFPPINEQRRVSEKIEELFSDLDAGVAALERARANLKRYRAAVLKAAVEGKLTDQWRKAHPDVEPASKLLERILVERRRKWEEAQLAKFEAAGKTPPKGWKDKYPEPAKPNATNLPDLPEGWCWATVEQLLTEPACNGISVRGSDSPPGVAALRLNAMSDHGFDFAQRRYIPLSEGAAQELAICKGDFFVSRGNGSLHLVGRGTLAQALDELVVFPDTMIRLRFAAANGVSDYLARIWPGRFIRGQVEEKAKTSAGIYKISQSELVRFVAPLPPLNEQIAILEEIEIRMTAIDRAERELGESLARATRLRQSILKRAFEGKLVPQDPSDEPALVLLERIRNARAAESSPRAHKRRKSPA